MNVDFTLLLPEILLAALGLVVLGVDLALPARFEHRRNVASALVAVLGLVGVFVFSLAFLWNTQEMLYNGLYFVDRYGLFFKALLTATAVVVIVMSLEYVGAHLRHPGEYYALVVFAVLGGVVMVGAGELLTAYVGVELLSFSLYVLVALSRGDRRTAEASTKYILLGAVSSAILLYGISVLYGVTESTNYRFMDLPLWANFTPTAMLGFAMVLGGLAFKLAVVPFHQWAPDVYEGAPTPVTALIAVLSKAAAFGLAIRLLVEAGSRSHAEWQMTVAILAALTMTVGSLVALVQNNVKRLLAYSSIAQVGFVLVGVVALTAAGTNAALLHLVGYGFTNLAVFMVVIAVENRFGKEEVADYAGLAQRAPFLAMVMTAGLFSLAGLPIFAGFITKFYLFTAVADQGFLWLAALAIANSVISLYYYLRIVREMYLGEPADARPFRLPRLTAGVLWATFAGTLLVGVYPGPLFDVIDAATRSLGPFAGN